MRQITTSVSTFANLREGDFVYVDKTDRLRELLRPAFAQYFMARPRRFGKSLTVSTLQAIFEGRRELFHGLAIEASDYDWKTYPVIRLDMGSCQAETVEEFRSKLSDRLDNVAHDLSLSPEPAGNVDSKFFNICRAAAEKSAQGQFVLLVDEYDKPLLGHLGRPTVEAFRAALKSFYSVIKTCEGLQRFAFITGVSKFSKVSIFSDLNNLTDVTLSAATATLMGYTHDEVVRNFSDHLAALAEANGLTREAAFDRVLAMYNGYRFEETSESVVNPVSLGRCLVDRKFKGYWYETGTPTFLVNELKKRPLDISNLNVSDDQLGTYEPSAPALVPLLFQTGYLTIKSLETLGGKRIYTLGFPNDEVRDAFQTSLVNVYTGGDDLELGTAQTRCAKALIAHDVDAFMESLDVFFANIPYNLTDRGGEQTFQAILYTILRFIGVCVEAEVFTNRGRVDAAITTAHDAYVIEVKLDHPARAALAQIKEKGYADKYRQAGKRLTLLGLSFSSEKRTVVEWLKEEA